MKLKTQLLPALSSIFLLASCSEKEETTQIPEPTEDSELNAFLLPEPPTAPIEISTLRQNAQPGETVTFNGQIMGADNPFLEGRAVMILGDNAKIETCDEIPGDTCPAPWDACCEDPDTVKNNIVTVQFLDPDGKPLKTDLKGFQGLKELSHLTITGQVTEASNPENMVINATGLTLKK